MAKHRRETPKSSLSEWIASLRRQPDQKSNQEPESDLSLFTPYTEWPNDIDDLRTQ